MMTKFTKFGSVSLELKELSRAQRQQLFDCETLVVSPHFPRPDRCRSLLGVKKVAGEKDDHFPQNDWFEMDVLLF